MKDNISLLKGLHPGILIDRELKKRKLPKGRFALSIDEFPQTLGAITKGKRSMNIPLSLKIEHALGMEEGYLMTLQIFHDIREEKRKQNSTQHPDLSKIRPALFWDTHMDKIDWQQQKRAIIRRIFERGNQGEKEEITRFYGQEDVDQALKNPRKHL